jgi:two-component system, NarL family, response regulator DesR
MTANSDARGDRSEDVPLRVLALVGRGLDAPDIAAQLGIASAEVQRNLTEVLGRLGAQNKIEALIIASRQGLLPPE